MSQQRASTLQLVPQVCAFCRGPLPKGRKKYCKNECKLHAQKEKWAAYRVEKQHTPTVAPSDAQTIHQQVIIRRTLAESIGNIHQLTWLVIDIGAVLTPFIVFLMIGYETGYAFAPTGFTADVFPQYVIGYAIEFMLLALTYMCVYNSRQWFAARHSDIVRTYKWKFWRTFLGWLFFTLVSTATQFAYIVDTSHPSSVIEWTIVFTRILGVCGIDMACAFLLTRHGGQS